MSALQRCPKCHAPALEVGEWLALCFNCNYEYEPCGGCGGRHADGTATIDCEQAEIARVKP